MIYFLNIFLMLSGLIKVCHSERILAVFPSPFPSHQSVFRPLTHELAKRGHRVVIITTDPAPKEKIDKPANLTEIDLHDISYEFRNNFPVKVTGRTDDIYDQIDKFYEMFGKLFEVQINTDAIRNLIQDKEQHFDLILTEACVRPALVFSHIFQAPVITFSSLGSVPIFTEYLGTPTHPLLYPYAWQQRLNSLTLWEKVTEVYKHYVFTKMLQTKEKEEDDMLKRNFGDDVPSLSELKKNVALLMINVHHVWEGNRPVPPNVVYLGGMHLEINETEYLPTELKSYLDKSTNGVIYMSLGSLVVPSLLNNLKIVIQSFSKLPYDILLKWDKDHIEDCPKNVRIVKWILQKELLYHPNIQLFITQGGLQSTDEAIAAGVPVIGIPILGDQWYNVEKFLDLNIGLRIDLETVTEKKMLDAINTVIDDKSYKHNIKSLRSLIYDQQQSSLDRAVWWTEYILRHRRSPHLKALAAHLSSWEYFEMDFILAAILLTVILSFILVYGVIKTLEMLHRNASIKLKLR